MYTIEQLESLEELQSVYNLLQNVLLRASSRFPVNSFSFHLSVERQNVLSIRDELRLVLGPARYQLMHLSPDSSSQVSR